jgi:thiol-disulfide isomerase/thioredoxin
LRPICFAALLSAAFCLPSLNAQTPATSPVPAAKPAPTAYESDHKYLSAIEDAKMAKRKREYAFAIDDYKKANKIAGGACVSCLNSIYELQMGLGEFKDAAVTASLLEPLATTPLDKSLAEGMRGTALLKQGGDKPKPAQLEAAHAALQSALTDYPRNNGARWSDACVLVRMGKNDDASKAFAACADNASAKDPMRMRAKHFAENPTLSLSKMAPAFEVTALDGTKFNLDAMGGKVVLIDFWATWCGPCNEELPHVQKIAKEFAGQPLVIISVSWDSDETRWKEFIQKHEMTWLQYRDADHSLSNRFGINAIPHYFTIDSDGVLTAEILGSGNDVEGKLKKLIKRANEAKAATPQLAANAAAAAEDATPVRAGQ